MNHFFAMICTFTVLSLCAAQALATDTQSDLVSPIMKVEVNTGSGKDKFLQSVILFAQENSFAIRIFNPHLLSGNTMHIDMYRGDLRAEADNAESSGVFLFTLYNGTSGGCGIGQIPAQKLFIKMHGTACTEFMDGLSKAVSSLPGASVHVVWQANPFPKNVDLSEIAPVMTFGISFADAYRHDFNVKLDRLSEKDGYALIRSPDPHGERSTISLYRHDAQLSIGSKEGGGVTIACYAVKTDAESKPACDQFQAHAQEIAATIPKAVVTP